MSYAFNIRAADKAAAKSAVRAQVDAVVANQAVHAHDANDITCNAFGVIALLENDPTCDVAVSLTGFVGSRDGKNLRTVSIACQATLMPREKA